MRGEGYFAGAYFPLTCGVGVSNPCSWLTHHLTNWMGDDGLLRQASCKIRRHNPEGDTLFIAGKVVRKFTEDSRHLVEIVQEAHNQDGELSVVGSGIVELPAR